MGLIVPDNMTTRERLIAELCKFHYSELPGVECRRLTEYLQDVLNTIIYIKKHHHFYHDSPGKHCTTTMRN